MPRSKSKRGKGYRPGRWDSHALYIDRRDLAALQEIFTEIGLIAEVKLPNGTCTENDVQLMRDYINLTSLLIFAGHNIDTDRVLKEYGEEWVSVQDRFHSYYKHRFVCKNCGYRAHSDLNGGRNLQRLGCLLITQGLV